MIDELRKKINALYPMLTEELKDKFENNMHMKTNLKNQKILKEILNDNYHNIDNKSNIKEILNILKLYRNKNINIEKAVYDIYLEINNINHKNFYNLSLSSVLQLCELKFNNINLNNYGCLGSYQIELLYKIANGKYKNDTEMAMYNNDIARIIDECLRDKDFLSVDLGRATFVFEESKGNVFIYNEDELEEPVVICSSNNEFLKGSYNDILKYCTRRIKEDPKTELDIIISHKTDETIIDSDPRPNPPNELLKVLRQMQSNN